MSFWRLTALAFTLCGITASAERAEVPELGKAPLVKRLYLGIEQGIIRPASFEQLVMENETRVAIHAQNGAKIKKGQHWATLAPLNLELERRSHALNKVKGEQDLAKELITFKEEQIKKQLARREAQAKLLQLQLASTDSSLPAPMRAAAQKAISEQEEQLALLDAELQPARVEAQRDIIVRNAVLNQEFRDKQLEDLEKRSLIIAGSDGTLVLGNAVLEAMKETEGDEPLWVKAGEVVGSLKNDDHYELWIDAQDPLLGNLPIDRLLVKVTNARSGSLLYGTNPRMEELDLGDEIKRRYVFRIDGENADERSIDLGVRSMVHVYVTFENAYHVIHKKDIAHLDPQRLESGGWSGLVKQLWPGCKVVYVGLQSIAIQPPDEH